MSKATSARTQKPSLPHFHADNEEEVRLAICDLLGITNKLKVLARTDGIWNGKLFEFKFSKKFQTKNRWNRVAYGALAQAIYYSWQIANSLVEGITDLPKTIVICDENGGFLIETRTFDWLLQFDPHEELDHRTFPKLLKFKKQFGFLRKMRFSWRTPPSAQNAALVTLLQSQSALDGVMYYDFKDPNQLDLFLHSVKNKQSENPTIPITQNNFVAIFERWLQEFAPRKVNRREWADRFVIDLRQHYKLNEKTGKCTHPHDTWSVPVERYKTFWKLYRRPPSRSVDEFIATNKDLLYDPIDTNNHGDYFTPLQLVSLAQERVARHLHVKRKTLWWDPAAGSGNLFFRFSNHDEVILTTKFANDVKGLRSNPSVKADLIEQIDFIHDDFWSGPKFTEFSKKLRQKAAKADRIVFFLNPPFDDQAESRKTNQSVPKGFIDPECAVPERALRSMHTRFFYRIMVLARELNKEVVVASFSTTSWISGPDASSFFGVWCKHFRFEDGFLVSSRAFRGIKKEWPCLFAVWKFDPSPNRSPAALEIDVFDKDYRFLGKKVLRPAPKGAQRLSQIAKAQISDDVSWVTVPPMKNEFEISESIYQDQQPASALGYLYSVANDVGHSASDVQIFSSIYGGGNHNGSPITIESFEKALGVYGVRKAIRRNWINNKDEYYLPARLSARHKRLLRMGAVFALVDGGYSSSVDISYQSEKYSVVNNFFIATELELRAWGARGASKFRRRHASDWISENYPELTKAEREAIKKAKELIKHSFKSGLRTSGDTKRQLNRIDASFRQLINGLYEYEGVELDPAGVKAYAEYLSAKEHLRLTIEREIYAIDVLVRFTQESSDSAVDIRVPVLRKKVQELQMKLARKAKSR